MYSPPMPKKTTRRRTGLSTVGRTGQGLETQGTKVTTEVKAETGQGQGLDPEVTPNTGEIPETTPDIGATPEEETEIAQGSRTDSLHQDPMEEGASIQQKQNVSTVSRKAIPKTDVKYCMKKCTSIFIPVRPKDQIRH